MMVTVPFLPWGGTGFSFRDNCKAGPPPRAPAFLLRAGNAGAASVLLPQRRSRGDLPRPHSVSIGPGLFCTFQPIAVVPRPWAGGKKTPGLPAAESTPELVKFPETDFIDHG